MSFILHRILATIPVVFGVITVTFFLIHLVPGDPVDIMLGDQASVADREVLRGELGLDKPILQQYTLYLTGLIKLDLGTSLLSKRPVTQEILERIPATIELTIFAMFWALLIGIPFGILASLKQYSWIDNSVLAFGLLGMSIPRFWLGPVLIWIFSIKLNLFPVSERGGLEHVILPSLSLGLALGAILIRMTRASMLEVVKEPYIQTALSKGLPFFLVYFKHALRNAAIPIITIVGLQFGTLLTGAVVTETIFDWPGIGTLFYQAITQRNYPLVQGCVLLISLTYVFVNLCTDLVYMLINPRTRAI